MSGMYRSVAVDYLRSEGKGLAFALILFLMALAAPSFGGLVDHYMPASYWIEVRAVHVDDALAGEDPPMRVDMEIRRPFRGDAIAIVKRRGINGFSYFCGGAVFNDFRADDVLPEPLTLSLWIWSGQCDLPPGRYLVDTLWRIETRSGRVREVRSRSNVFDIHRIAPAF